MKNHKFIQLFSDLNEKERRAFQRFVKSQYPSSRQLPELVDWFIQHTSREKYESKSFQDIHQYLFPEKAFDNKKISNLLSKLFLSLKEFCVLIELDHLEPIKSLLFLNFLRNRNAFGLFFKEFNSLQRAFQQTEHVTHWNALFKMISSYFRFYYPQTSISADEDLIDAWESHQLFSELLNLRFAIAAQNRFALLGSQQLAPLMEPPPIKVFLEESHPLFPLVFTFRALYNLYATRSEEYFFIVKDAYAKYFKKLIPEDQNQLLRHQINYAIDQYKNGRQKYFFELYKLYKFGISSKALLISNDLSSITFINIIDVACLAGDHEFAKQVYDNYLSQTNQEESSNNQLMGNAILLHAQKDYASARQALFQIQQPNIFLKIKSFELQTRIAYDAEDYEIVEDLIEKFKGMLVRAKELGSESLFSPYLNYLKFLGDISKFPPLSTDKLQLRWSELQPMANNKWVYEKIESKRQKKTIA